jgi:hypothetical protein
VWNYKGGTQYSSVLQRPFKLDADLFIQYFKLDDICILPYGKTWFYHYLVP